jgi:DNA polymerase III delta prime subunit
MKSRSLSAADTVAVKGERFERKPMLVDQLRPNEMDQLDFHPELDVRLTKLVDERPEELPNLIFYGSKGAGKKTRVHCVLNRLFQPEPDMPTLASQTFFASLSVETRAGASHVAGGSGVGKGSAPAPQTAPATAAAFATEMDLDATDDDLNLADENGKKDEKKPAAKPRGAKASALAAAESFGLSAVEFAKISAANQAGAKVSGTREQISCVRSPFHLEITPSDLDHKDFLVVRQCIKEFCDIAGSRDSVATCLSAGQSIADARLPRYRVVIINSADKLTFTAQASLRRIMEQYLKDIRFILVAEQISCVLPALQSRCALLRVPRPDEHKLSRLLLKSAQRLQLGGRFGGDRSAWQFGDDQSGSSDVFNDSDNFSFLPAPTSTMLVKYSRLDASYAQMMMMHNSQKEAAETHGHVSANPESFLTQHSQLHQPSWLENTILIGKALVLGYGIVQEKASVLAGWASENVGCNTYERPMLIWMRRVANELLSRCVPMQRFCNELLLAILAQIGQVEKHVNHSKDSRKPCWWNQTVLAPHFWSAQRCEHLRIIVVKLCAAFQQRIAVAFRPIVQIDALFVHLFEVCDYHRNGMPLPDASESIRLK